MTRQFRIRFGLATAMMLGFGFSAATLVAQDGVEEDMRSTLEGVYTAEQAERGEKLMWDICAECHFEEDYTGPFMQDWIGASVWGLFDSIWSTMPEDNPGSLNPEEYVDILAFLLRMNDYPTGEEALPADLSLLESIRIPGP